MDLGFASWSFRAAVDSLHRRAVRPWRMSWRNRVSQQKKFVVACVISRHVFVERFLHGRIVGSETDLGHTLASAHGQLPTEHHQDPSDFFLT